MFKPPKILAFPNIIDALNKGYITEEQLNKINNIDDLILINTSRESALQERLFRAIATDIVNKRAEEIKVKAPFGTTAEAHLLQIKKDGLITPSEAEAFGSTSIPPFRDKALAVEILVTLMKNTYKPSIEKKF